MNKPLLLSGCLLILTNIVHAQTTHQSLYWIRYFNQIRLTEKIYWVNEADERRYFNPDSHAQFIAHSHLHYQFKNLEVAGGITFSSVASLNGKEIHIPEWRPFQEFTLSHKLSSKINFVFRNRFDERFIHNSSQTGLTDGYSFVFRSRSRIQFQYVINVSPAKNLSIRLSDEFMIQFSKQTTPLFDQNRIYIGIEYPWNNHISTEIGYIKIYQSKRSEGFFNRDVIRVTLYHKIVLQ